MMLSCPMLLVDRQALSEHTTTSASTKSLGQALRVSLVKPGAYLSESYRWAAEIFHEFGKQVTGLEAAQVRKEEAVKRHFRLSCVAQSLLQQAPASGSATERFAFAQGNITIGQRVRTIARDALQSLLKLVEQLLAQGHSCEHILEVLMPA